jgi:peptidoglycan/LPS O-acetylase OafA/YrhL
MGTIFYKNYNGSISKNVYFLCLVLTVGYFGINHYFVISSSFGESLGLSLATLSALILFKISINYKNNISEFTMFYGEISYSLYLLHQMIGYYLINLIGENLFPSPWSQVFIFSLMTFVAFWVNRLIEVPTNAFGKKLAKHIQ